MMRHGLCFASVIEGETTSPARERCESTLFERIAASGITLEMLAVSDGGCVFAVDQLDVPFLCQAAQRLNVAIRLRSNCSRVRTRRGARPIPTAAQVIGALAREGIGIIHLFADREGVAVLVDTDDAPRAVGVMTHLGEASATTAA
jgi:aspartokinase